MPPGPGLKVSAGKAIFNGIKVSQGASFLNAVFAGPVDLGGAEIGGEFYADGAQLYQPGAGGQFQQSASKSTGLF